jgi:hypothetical protein
MPAGDGFLESGRLAEAALPPLAGAPVALESRSAVVVVFGLVVSDVAAELELPDVLGRLSGAAHPDEQAARPSRTSNVKLFRIQRLLLSPNKI